MDKEENKVISSDDNSSCDSDAEELLRDLDDDDEDEGFGYVRPGGSNNSLVNMLTSSANIGSYASSPSIGAVPANLAANKTDHTEADESKTDESKSENSEADEDGHPESHDDHEEDEAEKDKPAETKEEPARPAAESESGDKHKKLTLKPGIPLKKIKPFIPKAEHPAEEEKEKEKEKEAAPAEEKAESLKEPLAEATRVKPEAEEEHEKKPEPNASATRRPPIPPPITFDGTTRLPVTPVETKSDPSLLSMDAINDLLPGGKNDEARDLAAFKFNDNGWYNQVFNEDYFRTIPKNDKRQTVREARFIRESLGLQSKARVLDLCCGYGRHTIELAKEGYDMVGLDLSMTMLKRALKDAQDNGQAIKFVHGDMRKLAFKAIFDAIYNVNTSFGYFDEQSNFKVLQGVYRALKPGGVFMIETVNRDFMVHEFPLRLWWKGVECMLLEEIDMDYLYGVLQVSRSFVYDGNVRPPLEQKINIRLYSVSEMRALLKRAGFTVVELSGDYSLPNAHFGAASPRNIFIAEKPVK